jgi:hypothetical protein
MMSFIKRVLPFVLTFALGMFLASFFVSLSFPKIKTERRYQYRNECNYRRMRIERENFRQRNMQRDFNNYQDELVPPPPLVAPAAPIAEYTVPRGSMHNYKNGVNNSLRDRSRR